MQRIIDTRKAYHKTSKQLVNGGNACVHEQRQKDINMCWPKTSTFQSHQQSTEENKSFRILSIAAI